MFTSVTLLSQMLEKRETGKYKSKKECFVGFFSCQNVVEVEPKFLWLLKISSFGKVLYFYYTDTDTDTG